MALFFISEILFIFTYISYVDMWTCFQGEDKRPDSPSSLSDPVTKEQPAQPCSPLQGNNLSISISKASLDLGLFCWV